MVETAFLSRVRLFADLSDRDLSHLATYMQRRRYARGSLVFMRGDPGTHLYVVEEGQVKLVVTSDQGDELILGVLGPGDTFGELALVGEPRWVDAVSQTGSRLLVLHHDDFLPFVRGRPEVATRVIAIMSDWLRRLAELAGDGAFLDVRGRLAKTLLALSGADDRPGEDGLVISPKVTQVELAGMVGSTRRSVNKWLGYYQREGLIRVEKGYITLLQPDQLRRSAA